QLLLKNCPSRRVRPRLEDRPDALTRVTLSQPLQRLCDRRRMMTKVVDHFYSADFAADFLSSCNAFETRARLLDLSFREAIELCRGARQCRVANIEFSDQLQYEHV